MALCETVGGVEMHRVRLIVPGKWMLCASFILPQTVAFAKKINRAMRSIRFCYVQLPETHLLSIAGSFSSFILSGVMDWELRFKTGRRLEKMELVTAAYWSPRGTLHCELALVEGPQSAPLTDPCVIKTALAHPPR